MQNFSVYGATWTSGNVATHNALNLDKHLKGAEFLVLTFWFSDTKVLMEAVTILLIRFMENPGLLLSA